MSSIDEQFIDFIVKSLVSKPDAVEVKRTIDEKGVLLELTVDPEDLGRVIGKRGATAQSLRTLLRALGTKNDARYNLKIVDNGPPPADRRNDDRDDNKKRTDDDQTDQPDDDNTDDTVADEQVAAEDALNEDADASTLADEDEDSDEPSSLASQTRKELEELDDLDV